MYSVGCGVWGFLKDVARLRDVTGLARHDRAWVGVHGSGSRVEGFEFRLLCSGSGVQGLRFRDEGLGTCGG